MHGLSQEFVVGKMVIFLEWLANSKRNYRGSQVVF